MFTRRFTSTLRIIATFSAVAWALLAPIACAGATRFIDWTNGRDANDGLSKASAWKRAPGMSGFSGTYSHRAGDRFVFKGGVIWPAAALPLAIVGSGTQGNPDTYTTDHSWFSGASWSQPVFDGGGSGTQLITATSKHFVTIDDLSLKNMDLPGSNNGYAAHFENCTDLTLTNNRLQPYCWRGIYVVGYDGTAQTNIVIRNNDISDTGVPISIATALNGDLTTVIDNVEISGNKIHDLASMIVSNVHGDGIQIWTTPWPGTMPSVSASIFNNTFFGSIVGTGTGAMTAWIYLASGNGDYLVYNNVLDYSDVPTTANLFEALISVRGNSQGSTQIYNNTLSGTTPGMSAAILVENSQDVTVRNNILRGMQFCYYLQAPTSFSSDYNVFNSTTGAGGLGILDGVWKSFVQWQAMGNDIHGTIADPMLALPPSDLHLQEGSPAVGTGINLSAVFNTDRDGKTRTVPWDKGAYASGLPAPDYDGDGLPDAWELTYWPDVAGHGPLDDYDHDGYVELLELALGLNPTVPNPPDLPTPSNQGGYLSMTITKQFGVIYEVQSASTLLPNSFSTTTTTVLTDDSTTLKVRDNEPIGTKPSRFLRLKVTAAP